MQLKPRPFRFCLTFDRAESMDSDVGEDLSDQESIRRVASQSFGDTFPKPHRPIQPETFLTTI